MTSELKCPFCEYELQENRTTNLCCPICGLVAPTKLWQALIQAKQDLKIAKSYVKAVSQMVINSGDNIYIVIGHFKKLAEQTLKQIEHKEK